MMNKIKKMSRREAYSVWLERYSNERYPEGHPPNFEEFSFKTFRRLFFEEFGVCVFISHRPFTQGLTSGHSADFKFTFDETRLYKNPPPDSVMLKDLSYTNYSGVSIGGRKFCYSEGNIIHPSKENKLTLGWIFIKGVFDYLENQEREKNNESISSY